MKIKMCHTISAYRLWSFLLFAWGLLLSATASAVTVSASPTSCWGNGDWYYDWSNPNRAMANDGSYATISVDGGSSPYLACTGYNFSIPAGATINGITVNIKRNSNSTSNGGSMDAAVRLIKAGSLAGVDRSTTTIYSTADVTEPHGGSTDLWGASWSYDDINNADFGVAFAAMKPSSKGGAHTISVDWIQVTVDYTLFTCAPPANTPPDLKDKLTCVCDTFGRTSLNPSTIFGGNWTVSNSDGISNPYINQTTGLLRLTEKTTNNAKAATVPGIFPAAGNYISVEFSHYAYNGTGADGIGVTLSDYSVPAAPGAFGGSLGYAQKTGIPGFAGGWVGVALDEYGNYQSATEGRVLGACSTGACRPESVGVRGPGSGTEGYRWIGGTASNIGIDANTSTSPAPGYLYQVIVDARGSASSQINVTVSRDSTTRDGSSYTTLFGPSNVYSEAQYALSQNWIAKLIPDYWKISFTGSTGGSTNIHEIGGLRVCAQTVYPPTGGTASGFSAIDEAYPTSTNSVPAYQYFQSGDIYMKLAGVSFKLWVAALTDTGISTAYSAFSNKYLRVNLVDNSDNACGTDGARTCNNTCTNKAAVETGGSQIVSYASTDKGAKLSPSFTLNSSYKNLIAVIKECTDATCSGYTSTSPACSVDSFSVRPTAIASVTSSDATNAVTSGTPTFKAGSGNFALTATTVGIASVASRYTGNLKVDSKAIQVESPATTAGVVSGSFAAATSGTPSSTASGSFTYSEVGAFRFLGYDPTDASKATLGRGVYDGVAATECQGLNAAQCDVLRAASWTGIDSVSSKADCVPYSYLNAKDSNGKYGCNFGISANTSAFGRFIPHHFGITNASIVTRSDMGGGSGCTPTSTFTYMGEPARVSFTLQAQNASNEVTKNYAGTLAKLSTATAADWLAYGSSNSMGLWMLATGYPVGVGTCKAIFSTTTPYSTSFDCTGVANPTAITRASGARVSISGTPSTPNWLLGQSVFTADVVLERADRADGPYANLSIGIAPRDTDGITLSTFDMDADNNSSNERRSLGVTEMRYGQMRIDNAYGSELLALPVNVTATYWNGTFFTPNAQDSCTSTSSFSLKSGSWKGDPASGTSISSVSAAALNGGAARITLAKPSPRPASRSSVLLQSTLPYLPGTGQETFGVYRNKFIYLREMY